MRIRPLAFLRRRWKKLGVLLLVLLIGVNYLAARHANAFLVYAPEGEAIQQPERLSLLQKIGLLFSGVSVQRPVNSTTPAAGKLPFETVRIPIEQGWLEVWRIPTSAATRGTVLLFPGYASAKSSLLDEAGAFRRMGFDAVLVDFRGAGGSSGHENTLGVREAEDVVAVLRWESERNPGRIIILFGRSMGSVAILRAIAHHHANPSAIVLECPFDRMLNAVRNRFRAMGIPTFPGAELLLFWGGRRAGIDGFAHNPVDDAEAVTCPVLILAGSQDARATPEQVRNVYDRIRGEKKMAIVDGAAHEPFRVRNPAIWDQMVGEFLQAHIP